MDHLRIVLLLICGIVVGVSEILAKADTARERLISVKDASLEPLTWKCITIWDLPAEGRRPKRRELEQVLKNRLGFCRVTIWTITGEDAEELLMPHTDFSYNGHVSVHRNFRHDPATGSTMEEVDIYDGFVDLQMATNWRSPFIISVAAIQSTILGAERHGMSSHERVADDLTHIEFRNADGVAQVQIELDAAQGWMPIRAVIKQDNGLDTIRMAEYREVQRDAWYPVKGTMTSVRDGKVMQELSFKVVELQAEQQMDLGGFDVLVSRDAVINDHRYDCRFQMSSDQGMDEDVSRLTHEAQMHLSAKRGSTFASPRSVQLLLLSFLGGALAAMAINGLWSRSRRRNRPHV